MTIRGCETPNQAALLRALSTHGARLAGSHWGRCPVEVCVSGVPRPIHTTQKQTVRACQRRGWIVGSDEKGYGITHNGVLALGAWKGPA